MSFKKITKADGTISFVNEEFLDSVVSENDTIEDIQTVSRSEPTSEEIAESNLNSLRNKRNQLLIESDWTQILDIPEDIRLSWQPYRQALRDITDNYTSLEDVVWPEKPL